MKSKLSIFIFLIASLSLSAQNNLSYNQKAAEIKKNIWEKDAPIFKSNTIPEKYNNESAVILARTFDMQRISGSKFKFLIVSATAVTNTNKTVTFREKVKINDKIALEKFSKLEYDKVIDKTQSFLFLNVKNKKEIYIGVKIIKPNGKEIIVDVNEEATLANNDKDKKSKLAIPGLQVGDIIDYYISTVQVVQGSNQQEDDNKYLFFLADEYPVLNYSYTFQYNKKVNVFHMSANGAPNFDLSSNDDKDQILTIKGKDMPKHTSELWSSPLRELPYFTVSSYFTNTMDQMATRNYDRYDKKLSRLDNFINAFQLNFNTALYPFSEGIEKQTKTYFKSSKNFKSLPLDSTMKIFYNVWKFNTFCNYYTDNFDMADKAQTRANTKYNTTMASQILSEMEIPHDIMIVSSKFSNSLENVFEDEDFDTFIRINGQKPLYMSFYRINTNFNEIPIAFQGEKAIVLTPKRHNKSKYSFIRSETKIPTTTHEENSLTETVAVNFAADNMQKLNISRNVKAKESMRVSDQLNLILFEDIDNELKTMLNGKDLKTRLSDFKKPKKTLDDYTAAFGASRKNLKESFIEELKEQYGETPKDVQNFKVINSAITNNNPIFEYTSDFSIETFVKKAGNNYILDLGKLIGTPIKFEEDKRIRQTNIYMPAARSLDYNIDIVIPQGYKLNGVNDLSTQVKNDAGSFSVTTKLNDQKLSLNIKRVYTKSQLAKQQWTDVLALLDAASIFSEKKVLLEKNKI